MVFHRLKLISTAFLSLAVTSPTSLMAQGDMGPIGTVVLENMVREQNPPSYDPQAFRSRPSYKHTACKTHKMHGCQRGKRWSKAN
ncbi:hypothetical protein [Methylocystis sp. SC2]|uniref:hypothetical protein n=1 Tax=Methylocystis sp. (strain SC2) TaxID=187303 RepID=UPI00027AE730|nr:hypothetical protein [Methylocystis sp. SC2]CCJ06673.1 Hypothetical protein BN69_1222 [Methylocystis sp. SC2]